MRSYLRLLHLFFSVAFTANLTSDQVCTAHTEREWSVVIILMVVYMYLCPGEGEGDVCAAVSSLDQWLEPTEQPHPPQPEMYPNSKYMYMFWHFCNVLKDTWYSVSLSISLVL